MPSKSNILSDDVAYYLQEYSQARDADDPDRRRGISNMLAYTSINDGMYSKADQQSLKYEGRSANSYNFMQVLVRGHHGNAMSNWVDPMFISRDSENLNATEAASKVWYANKEHNNYKSSSMSCIEDGYVYRGVQELVIKKPNSNPRDWTIDFPHIRSDLVIFDPSNTGDRISRHSKKAWKIPYLSISQMKRLWPEKEMELMTSLQKDEKKTGVSYEARNIDQFKNLNDMRFGSNYQVVEFYHIEDEKVNRQILKTGQVLPETCFPLNSEEDVAAKVDWMLKNNISIPNGSTLDEQIISDTSWEPVLYVTTFCPALGIILGDGKDERQLGGHLPFYAWSFMQKNGKSIGLIDFLWDPQMDLNKREMAKTKVLTQTPIAGKTWISEDIVGDGDKNIEDFINDANDPSKPAVIPSGIPAERMMGIYQASQIPSGYLSDESVKIDFMERISSLPSAMQGRTGNSAESGIAIGRKVIEGSIMHRMPMEWIAQHENDKAEDWLIMGSKIYGGPANINRKITFNGGKETVTINKAVGIDEDGETVLENDMSRLDRTDVIISQTKENDYMKQMRLETSIASIQAMQGAGPPNAGQAYVLATLQSHVVKNLNYATEEERTAAERSADANIKIAELQAQAAINQLSAQANPQPSAQQRQLPQQQTSGDGGAPQLGGNGTEGSDDGLPSVERGI